MSLAAADGRRTLPVRLCDIAFDIRVRAARDVARREPEQGPLVLAAALHPSSRTYFVERAARPLLEAIAA